MASPEARDVGIGRSAISFFDKPVRGSRAFSERVCELQAGPHSRGEPAGVGPAGAIRQQQIAQPRQQPLVVQTRTGYFQGVGSVDSWSCSQRSYFTDNTDFFNGGRSRRRRFTSCRGIIIYNFPSGVWVSLDGTYFTGGRTTLNGVRGDNEQTNTRVGLTVALPVDRQNSIKLNASTGISPDRKRVQHLGYRVAVSLGCRILN